MKAKKSVLITILASVVFLVALFSFYSFPALAGDPSAGGIVPCGTRGIPCTLCHFVIGVQTLVLYGIYIVIALAMLALVFTGITYIFSSGNESMMTAAKGFLKGTLIGFAVIFGGWLIVTAALQIFAARGDLGIQDTDSWSTFTCNTASSALIPRAPAPSGPGLAAAPGSGLTPGTANGPCGENLVGTCRPLTGSGLGFDTCRSYGMTWLETGTSCPTGYWCCAGKIPLNGGCVSFEGVPGRCEALTTAGGSDTQARVCPNRSIRMQEDGMRTPVCDYSGQNQGCCDPNASPAGGIEHSDCGNPTLNAKCRTAGSNPFNECSHLGMFEVTTDWLTYPGRIPCQYDLVCCSTIDSSNSDWLQGA